MKKIALIALVCAFIAAPAFADLIGQVRMAEVGTNPAVTGGVWMDNMSATGYIGLYRFGYDFAYPLPAVPGLYTDVNTWGFCIEKTFSNPNAYYTADVRTLEQAPVNGGGGPGPGGTMGAAKADYLRELWAAVAAHGVNIGPSMTQLQAVAMQLAVWEIVYEDDKANWNVTTMAVDNVSGFKTNLGSTYTDLASTYLGYVTGNGAKMGPELVALVNADVQDYIVTPVPAALLLGLLGLGAAGVKLRKFA